MHDHQQQPANTGSDHASWEERYAAAAALWSGRVNPTLAAQAADSFPMLVVVPNVVKTNWAREAGIWTPQREATVISSAIPFICMPPSPTSATTGRPGSSSLVAA